MSDNGDNKADWYYSIGPIRYGPVDISRIRSLPPDTPVWHPTLGKEWVVASSIPGLIPAAPAVARRIRRLPEPAPELVGAVRAELDARAASGHRDAESRQLLAEAAQAMGRCASRLAREKRPGGGEASKGDRARPAANPLVKAQEYDTVSIPGREPDQRWLDACEVAASAMGSDAVPRRFRVAVRSYFAPGQPLDPSGRP